MVAINEQFHRKGKSPQCGRRSRKDRFGRCSKPRAASESSVAGNYPNGGVTGDIPNGTTDYIWQGWQTMEERNPFGGSGSTDTPVKQYIWGTYIDECLQINLLSVAGPQSLPVGAYYLLQDLLYRAVALTNSSGQFVEAYDTDAYGNTLIFTAPGADGVWFTDDVQSNYGANSIVFCGYWYDAETENYYVRNRFYSPTLGRWIQRDPIGYAGGIAVYEYAFDRPNVRLDSSGLQDYATGPIEVGNLPGASGTVHAPAPSAVPRSAPPGDGTWLPETDLGGTTYWYNSNTGAVSYVPRPFGNGQAEKCCNYTGAWRVKAERFRSGLGGFGSVFLILYGLNHRSDPRYQHTGHLARNFQCQCRRVCKGTGKGAHPAALGNPPDRKGSWRFRLRPTCK